MLLTRTSDGRLLDSGNEIVLRGAHCHTFSAVAGGRYLTRNGRDFYLTFPTADAQANGCAATLAEEGLAIANWGTFETCLDRLAAAEGNLARVFLGNGVEFDPSVQPAAITTLHPFARRNGKWRVAAAIRDKVEAAWSAPFFAALTRFVRAADQRGIAVQLCLFSYHEFTDTDLPDFKYWPASYWNAANADDPSWADNNLIPVATGNNPSILNHAFMEVGNYRLMAVQRAYVERVLAAVAGSGNVILELMNEPRVGDGNGQHFMANWLSLVTGWIRDWLQQHGTTPRPLISANASYPLNGTLPSSPNDAPASDVDAWGALGIAHYGQLDIVSYHGLTGVADISSGCGSAKAQQTHPAAIRSRIDRHKINHPQKAMILSTDAVRFGAQILVQADGKSFEAQRRDALVRTGLDSAAALPPVDQVTRHDLSNWAFSVFREALKSGDRGRVHFQNHSTYEPSFAVVRSAFRAASGAPPAPADGGLWRAALTRVVGGANHQNFWWAHRFGVASGELVNQLHTENGAGPAAAATGESEIGWRYELQAAGGAVRLSAVYELVSVSEIEDAQATVEQRLRLAVAPLANGQPGAPIGVAERVLQRGQSGLGRLELEATLPAGQACLVSLTSEVKIVYQNRAKVGYGETIVRFPRLFVG